MNIGHHYSLTISINHYSPVFTSIKSLINHHWILWTTNPPLIHLHQPSSSISTAQVVDARTRHSGDAWWPVGAGARSGLFQPGGTLAGQTGHQLLRLLVVWCRTWLFHVVPPSMPFLWSCWVTTMVVLIMVKTRDSVWNLTPQMVVPCN